MWGISGGPVIEGWVYDSGYHCDDCGRERFGDKLFNGTARDNSGDEPTPVYSYSEESMEVCETCGEFLDGSGPSKYSTGCDEGEDEDLDDEDDEEVVIIGAYVLPMMLDHECPICRQMAGLPPL